jgi:hypothetical protein
VKSNLSVGGVELQPLGGPAFRAERDPLAFFPFRRFGHYNENGYGFVAKVLQKALRALVIGCQAVGALVISPSRAQEFSSCWA